MTTESVITELRDAYVVWQSLPIAFEYGPLRSYPITLGTKVQEFWREMVDPAISLVAATERHLTDGSHVADAPSPWHAYFYLRAQQQHVFRSGRPLNAVPADDRPPVGEHLFFRGQRCADWSFASSFFRKDVASREFEKRAVEALTEYFRLMFAANEDIAMNAGRCFAQHYGIATELADISCDPDVAIWFATHPLDAACPSGEARAVVRAVTWMGQEDGARTEMLLPPPFVRNVYTQRGLFLDTSGTDGILKGSLQLEVRFPRTTAGGQFDLIRGGQPVEVWPDPDPSERELVRWAREIAVNSSSIEDVAARVQHARTSGSFPTFWLDRELSNFEEHVGPWLSILDWVLPATCVTGLPLGPDAPQPMRYEILERKARALIRANPSLFGAFADAADPKVLARFEVLRGIVTIARQELGG